jgi:RNA polymerase sigma-70 factor (ECF subfamily)
MEEGNGRPKFSPERYREYLHMLARLNLPKRLRSVLSASDVAHDTILKADKKREQFRGQTEAQYRAWLRAILAHLIADAADKEPDILRKIEKSSTWLKDLVAVDDPSPSEQVVRAEQLRRLAELLMELPDDERTAVEMRYLQVPRCRLPEIAEALGRPTAKAVARLLGRGLERLRGVLREDS